MTKVPEVPFRCAHSPASSSSCTMLPTGYFPITSWQSWATSPTALVCLTSRLQTDPAFPAPPTFIPSLTFLPLGPLPGLHAPQPLHPHLSLQPFPDFPWRESQGKEKDYSVGRMARLKGYMNLKTEKQKVKKWIRETELWGHNGKRSNTHATDRVLSAGPDEMAFPVLLFCGCLAFFCLFLCKKRSNKDAGVGGRGMAGDFRAKSRL